jgi:RNA 3'-terminal phosphate cyclase (ATP)
VADKAVREMRTYLKTDVPVGEHLADQLLLPLALAGSGSYRTLPLSLHARTQVELIPEFLDGGRVRVGVS